MVQVNGVSKETIDPVNYLMFLAFFIVPLYGTLSATIYWWGKGIDLFYVLLFIAMYIPKALGTTCGYHRFFAHESFKAKKWVALVLGICGSSAIQGQIMTWVLMHVDLHHRHSDKPGDPHSPVVLSPDDLRHASHWAVFKALCKGFWHAQIGWMFLKQPLDYTTKCAIRLQSDPVVRFVDKYILLWILLGGVIPTLAGYLHEKTWQGAMHGFVCNLVVLFFHQHFTSSVNSICHMFGDRKFRTGDKSTDNWFIAIFTFGEGAHNSHHAFMKSALHYIDRPWLDGTFLFVKILEKLHLVWDVSVPSKERVRSMRIGNER